ncbi:MAG: hypothetical protein ACFFCW_09995 [Candidatus Hodarchaeota archaeon]
MTDKVYRCDNVELLVKDREKLKSLKDEDFMEELQVGWPTNLYRLHKVDPTEIIKFSFPTDKFLVCTKGLKRNSNKFLNIFLEAVESPLRDELRRRHIDLNKLHYGMEDERGIKYEYCHITKNDHADLLREHGDKWYKIICVVPIRQIHRDIFFAPQKRLHEFFVRHIYECYNGKKREIIHIEPITREKAEEEIRKIKNTIKRHKHERFRTDEFLQTRKKDHA